MCRKGPMFEDDRFDDFADLATDLTSDLTSDLSQYDLADSPPLAPSTTYSNGHGQPGQTLTSPSTLAPPSTPAPPPFTIPGLFPRRSVNLLIGTPKSGRLRFILPQLDNYAAGLPFLNLPVPSPPEQLGMILCARKWDSVWGKLRQLDLTTLTRPQVFPIEKWSCSPDDQSEPLHQFPLELPYQRLTATAGRPPRFLFVEGIQLVLTSGKSNDLHAVAEFFNRLQAFCDQHDCTILGTVGMAKAKRGDQYELLPHRILGSAQWAEATSCLIGIEKSSPSSEIRRITTMASEGPQPVLYADFDLQGRLLLCDRPERPAEAVMSVFTSRIEAADPGTVFTRKEFLEWADSINLQARLKGEAPKIGIRTVDRWIGESLDLGRLVATAGRGEYMKPLMN